MCLAVDTKLTELCQAYEAADIETFDTIVAQTLELTDFQTQIVDQVETLRAQSVFSDEDVRAAETLANVHQLLDTQIKARAQAAKNFSAFADRLTVKGEPEQIEESVPAVVEEAPKADPAALVARLAQSSGGTRGKGLVLNVPEKSSLVAASDVPGVPNGSEYKDWEQLAEATARRWQSMRGGPDTGAPLRAGLALFKREFPAELTAGADLDIEMLEYASNPRRLSGGSLVAAGGWCSPSETLYSLCELETNDGLLSVPELLAARGGVRFTPGPTFSDIYSNTGFTQTETQAIANTPKTCFEIDCPTYTDHRLEIIGTCLTAGILEHVAFPEYVARWLRGALVAHAHRVNAFKLAQMVTGSTVVDYTAIGTIVSQGATSGLLETVEMQIEDMRHFQRLSLRENLEVVLPVWARAVCRADLSKRNSAENWMNVTDADVDQWFHDRGASIQWVYDFQDAFTQAGAGLGGATPATAWPTVVKFLIYPVGTWVAAVRDIITLDAGIYDSTNILTNRYNALFSEEGIAMLKKCQDSRVVSVPICPSGYTSKTVDMGCS
jgi:hypothetical protein